MFLFRSKQRRSVRTVNEARLARQRRRRLGVERLEGRDLLAAIIDNGTVQLGINDEGHLNVPGPASSGGVEFVGLRYMPTNAESTAPGCLCEGWGVANATSGATGWANEAGGGTFNLVPVSFTANDSSAVSVVDMISGLDAIRVTHDYHPTALTPNLYEVTVTIENKGAGAITDLRYRRVMDWDVEPTAFSEYVTIETGGEPTVAFTSDNGFEVSDPLGPRSAILFTGEATDSGIADHGALFDFELGALATATRTSFNIYYGAAGTEAAALAAIAAVNSNVYSLGQTATDPAGGTPNTFIFAFGNLREDAENTPPVANPDNAATSEDTPVVIPGGDLLANDTDADNDALSLQSVSATSAEGGTVSLDPVTLAVTYTPPAGFSGLDTFTYTVSDGLDTDDGIVTVLVGAAPDITDVIVRFGSQSYSLLNNAERILPWTTITAIDIIFADEVEVDNLNVTLEGINVPNYSGVLSQSGANKVTLSLASAIGRDRLKLSVEGDSDEVDFDVLPGDFNGDGVVTIQDSVGVRNHMPAYGAYDLFADLDGDGDVDINDANAPRNKRLGHTLPPPAAD